VRATFPQQLRHEVHDRSRASCNICPTTSPLTGHPECAGLNRRVVGDERALQERRTANPSWPRVLRASSRGGGRSVDRGERPTRLRILRGESPRAVNCLFGRQAYAMHAEVTKHVLLGRKSLSCPAAVCAGVGTIWEVSKLGGLNIKKCLQLRKYAPRKIVFAGRSG
jgi:hypothetical protein